MSKTERKSIEDLDFGGNPLFEGGDDADNLLTGFGDTDALLSEFERSSPVHYQSAGGGYHQGDLSPLSSIGSEPLFGAGDKHTDRPNEFLIDLDEDFPEAPSGPSNADFLSQLDSQLQASPHKISKAKGPPSLSSIDKQLQEVGNEAYSLIDLVSELSAIIEEEAGADDIRARLRPSLEATMATANNVLSGLCTANEDLTQLAASQPSQPVMSFRSNPLADPEEEEQKARGGMKTLQSEAELVSLRKKIDALTLELKERQKSEAVEKQRASELEAQVVAVNEEHRVTLSKLESAFETCQMLRSSLDRCADAAVVLASSSSPGEQRDNEDTLASAIEASMRLVDKQADTLVLPEVKRSDKAPDPHFVKVSSLNSWSTKAYTSEDPATHDLAPSMKNEAPQTLSEVPEYSFNSHSSIGDEKTTARSAAAETSWSHYKAGDDTSLPSLPGGDRDDDDDSDEIYEELDHPSYSQDGDKEEEEEEEEEEHLFDQRGGSASKGGAKRALRVTVTSPAGATPPVLSPVALSTAYTSDASSRDLGFAPVAPLPAARVPSRLQVSSHAAEGGPSPSSTLGQEDFNRSWGSAVKRGREAVDAVTGHDDDAAVEGLRKELDALLAENQSLVTKFEEASTKAELQAQYAEQEARNVAQLAAELDKAEAQIAELEASNGRMARELESSSIVADNLRDIQKRVWVLEEECEQAKGNLRAASADFSAKKKDMIERLKRRDTEIAEAEARAEKAEKELLESEAALVAWKAKYEEADLVLSRASERAKSITQSVMQPSGDLAASATQAPMRGSSRIPSFSSSNGHAAPHITGAADKPPLPQLPSSEWVALQTRALELEGQLKDRELEIQMLSCELEGLMMDQASWKDTLEKVEAVTASLKARSL